MPGWGSGLPGSRLCSSGTARMHGGHPGRLSLPYSPRGCMGQPCPVTAGNTQHIYQKHQGRTLQTTASLCFWERLIAFNRKWISLLTLLSRFIRISTDWALQTDMEVNTAAGILRAVWKTAVLLTVVKHVVTYWVSILSSTMRHHKTSHCPIRWTELL